MRQRFNPPKVSVTKLQFFFFIFFCLSIVGVAAKSIFCTHLWWHSNRSTTHYHGGALSSRTKTNCKFAVSHRQHRSLFSLSFYCEVKKKHLEITKTFRWRVMWWEMMWWWRWMALQRGNGKKSCILYNIPNSPEIHFKMILPWFECVIEYL